MYLYSHKTRVILKQIGLKRGILILHNYIKGTTYKMYTTLQYSKKITVLQKVPRVVKIKNVENKRHHLCTHIDKT